EYAAHLIDDIVPSHAGGFIDWNHSVNIIVCHYLHLLILCRRRKSRTRLPAGNTSAAYLVILLIVAFFDVAQERFNLLSVIDRSIVFKLHFRCFTETDVSRNSFSEKTVELIERFLHEFSVAVQRRILIGR